MRPVAKSAAEWRAAGYEVGPAGPVFRTAGDWARAVETLTRERAGMVPDALVNAEVPGSIAVVHGRPRGDGHDGYGLAKIMQLRPHLIEALPESIAGMRAVRRDAQRILLEGPTDAAVLARDYAGKDLTWLLTAFDRKGALRATDDGQVAPYGRTDTAPPAQGVRNVAPPSRPRNGDGQ